MTPTIETERLTMRRFTEDDADFTLRLLNEPSFHQHIGDRGVRTVEQARAYLLKGPIGSYAEHGYGPYLVIDKATGAPAGLCGLINRETLDGVDLGFAFVPEFWGRGYARESAQIVLDQARNELELDRVLAIVSKQNGRSKKLLTKLGFEFSKTVVFDGDDEELELHVVTLQVP